MNTSDNNYLGAAVDSANNGTSAPESIYLDEYNLTLKSVQYNAMSEDAQIAIVNVTREYPFNYATIMFGYMMPFVLILTMITNSLVVMVLAQRHMRTPTNIVLLTMAIVDLMTLLSPSPWYFYIYTLGYHDKFLYPPIWCYFHYLMTDVVPVYFHTSSIWLALLLASQRYIYVCHPTLANTWCTVPRVKKAIIIILVIAFLHQVTRFFDNTFVPIYLETESGYHLACKNEIADWVHSIDIAFYYTTYYTFRILFVFIIPCVALITLNCLLFGALRRAENKRTELLRTKFKIIGGNHCSPGAMAKQTSYAVSSDMRAVTEPAGGLLATSGRRISSNSTTKQGRLKGSGSFKRRKFSISSFSMKPATKLDQAVKENTNKRSHLADNNTKNSFKRNQPAICDTGLSCSMLDDQGQFVRGSKTSNCGVVRNNSSAFDRDGKIIRATLSQESNDDCSIAMQQPRGCCSADGHHLCERNKSRQSIRGKKQFEVNRQQLQESFDDTGADGDQEDQSTKEEDSTCLECASCKQNEELACQGCSAISNGGATCTGTRAAADDHRLHQAASQCSSLIGGATNTTTNEDVSSCIETQNASSSMFVARDGTMDELEVASMRADEEICADQENLSLQNDDSRLKGDEEDDEESIRPIEGTRRSEGFAITKSGSMDSRLACGCLSGVKPRLAASFRHATSGRSSTRGKQNCRECCLTEGCRNSPVGERLGASKARRRHPKECFRSSDSESSFAGNCKNEATKRDGSIKADSRSNANGAEASKKLSSSRSDYGANDRASFNRRSNDDTSGCNAAIATTTTNTTTTTTLYSTTANSTGSLLQVQQNHANLPINRQLQRQPNQKSALPQARMKSPSFASSIGGGVGGGGGGGRGSRATSVGGSNLPTTLATVSASTRTMDSNRTTLMLIVVVTVFLLVEVPVALVTILHVVFNIFDTFADLDFAFNYIKLFTNFFIMISYSVNFTIYCSMSKKFRETFRDLVSFLCGRGTRRRRLLYQQQQQQQQQHSQYNQHQFNSQNMDNQVMMLNATNINSNVNSSNDFAATTGLLRYCPYRRTNSQQQECEL